MKVRVDAGLCQGHNRGYALAPDLFQLDDAGFSSAVGDGTVPPGREEAAELAADNCPETAVLIDE
jgi:ferredoxin